MINNLHHIVKFNLLHLSELILKRTILETVLEFPLTLLEKCGRLKRFIKEGSYDAKTNFATNNYQSAGNKPKIIQEFIGMVNSGTENVSIAKMKSPSGWVEPGQQPEFDEFTIVLKGELNVKSKDGEVTVCAGQAIHTKPGEWIQYSTPHPDGCEYIAVCLPAFSPNTVHRDGE